MDCNVATVIMFITTSAIFLIIGIWYGHTLSARSAIDDSISRDREHSAMRHLRETGHSADVTNIDSQTRVEQTAHYEGTPADKRVKEWMKQHEKDVAR